METHFPKIHTSVPKWGVCVLKLTGGYNHRRKRKKGEVGILIANLFFIFFLVERKKLKGLKFNTRKGFGVEKHYYCFRQRKKKKGSIFSNAEKTQPCHSFCLFWLSLDCEIAWRIVCTKSTSALPLWSTFFQVKKWLLFLKKILFLCSK